MPIYDYLCSNCRKITEVIHGINDPGPKFCPACGAEGTMRKAMSTPTVHFKGSGWAKKDRSSTSSARTKASASSSSGESGSGAGESPSTDKDKDKASTSSSTEPTKSSAESTVKSED